MLSSAYKSVSPTKLIIERRKNILLTGLCSKGTSISKPGSHLWPRNPLVSPPVSSFKALTETLWNGLRILWYWISHEPYLVTAFTCLGLEISVQYTFARISIYSGIFAIPCNGRTFVQSLFGCFRGREREGKKGNWACQLKRWFCFF